MIHILYRTTSINGWYYFLEVSFNCGFCNDWPLFLTGWKPPLEHWCTGKALLSQTTTQTSQHPLLMMASSIWVKRNCKNRTNAASNLPENTLKAFCNQQPVSWDNYRACVLHILFYHTPLEPYSQQSDTTSHSWQCSRSCAAHTLQAMRSLLFCCFIPPTRKLLWNSFSLTGIAMGGRAVPSTLPPVCT